MFWTAAGALAADPSASPDAAGHGIVPLPSSSMSAAPWTSGDEPAAPAEALPDAKPRRRDVWREFFGSHLQLPTTAIAVAVTVLQAPPAEPAVHHPRTSPSLRDRGLARRSGASRAPPAGV